MSFAQTMGFHHVEKRKEGRGRVSPPSSSSSFLRLSSVLYEKKYIEALIGATLEVHFLFFVDNGKFPTVNVHQLFLVKDVAIVFITGHYRLSRFFKLEIFEASLFWEAFLS